MLTKKNAKARNGSIPAKVLNLACSYPVKAGYSKNLYEYNLKLFTHGIHVEDDTTVYCLRMSDRTGTDWYFLVDEDCKSIHHSDEAPSLKELKRFCYGDLDKKEIKVQHVFDNPERMSQIRSVYRLSPQELQLRNQNANNLHAQLQAKKQELEQRENRVHDSLEQDGIEIELKEQELQNMQKELEAREIALQKQESIPQPQPVAQQIAENQQVSQQGIQPVPPNVTSSTEPNGTANWES